MPKKKRWRNKKPSNQQSNLSRKQLENLKEWTTYLKTVSAEYYYAKCTRIRDKSDIPSVTENELMADINVCKQYIKWWKSDDSRAQFD